MLSFGRSWFLNLWFNLNRYRKVKSISKLPYLKFWPSYSQVCPYVFFPSLRQIHTVYGFGLTYHHTNDLLLFIYDEKPMLIYFKYTVFGPRKWCKSKKDRQFFGFGFFVVTFNFSGGGPSMRFQYFCINNRYINRSKIRIQFVISANTQSKQNSKWTKSWVKNFLLSFLCSLNLKWF